MIIMKNVIGPKIRLAVDLSAQSAEISSKFYDAIHYPYLDIYQIAQRNIRSPVHINVNSVVHVEIMKEIRK